ncbi:MAG: chemotaxis response regulator protein-glutamate methylesterase [Alteromonadaceae bacterium]|nr:chemotaxis response regulator protein-glutamate methylesterase [Alteromonadaceae bacterium]MBL4911015.1 chemotaxis response regulator protein-glutamate methylesterase [Alteromonadaceae bacterium]
MAYKVLVVDDSSFFRRRLADILNKDNNLTVIDVAVNGQEAVDKAIALKPDVITMDIEMPILNGIDAVRQIMAKAPTAVLMFSSLTHQGAKATLEALDAGALDFLPKKFNEIAQNSDEAGALLRQRVTELARRKKIVTRQFTSTSDRSRKTVTANAPIKQSLSSLERSKLSPVHSRTTTSASLSTSKNSAAISSSFKHSSGKKYKLLAIGTSTGGPVALQKVLTQIPENFPLPIILIQHMPAAFTSAFASRLNVLCKINVKEAQDGDVLKAGCAYLAPGGRQMIIEGNENNAKLKILDDNSPRITYKPSVDISFGSAAKVYAGNVLAVILTGMGADGREGSRMLKSKGATVWSQNEQTCVVYGMPQAVTVAGISQLELPIEDFSAAIIKEVAHG